MSMKIESPESDSGIQRWLKVLPDYAIGMP